LGFTSDVGHFLYVITEIKFKSLPFTGKVFAFLFKADVL